MNGLENTKSTEPQKLKAYRTEPRAKQRSQEVEGANGYFSTIRRNHSIKTFPGHDVFFMVNNNALLDERKRKFIE